MLSLSDDIRNAIVSAVKQSTVNIPALSSNGDWTGTQSVPTCSGVKNMEDLARVIADAVANAIIAHLADVTKCSIVISSPTQAVGAGTSSGGPVVVTGISGSAVIKIS
jgi:hypothetical protein